MKIELTHKTFNNQVKRFVATELKKVKTYKAYGKKTVALRDENGQTIAIWEKDLNGSKIFVNSWY
jgi:hypothetical protein